jgi:AcrR family transcriptional regulator
VPKRPHPTTDAAPSGKRERTRAALIDAAAELIAEEGYDRLSMNRVALRAGMTKGAIYGNFDSKEDLVIEAFLATLKRSPPALIPGASASEQLRVIAEDMIAMAPRVRAAATQLVAFELYALTHEDMRVRAAKYNAVIYGRMESWVRRMFPIEQLRMPPAHFVRVLHALSNGLLVIHALAPDLVSADVVRSALATLANDDAPNDRKRNSRRSGQRRHRNRP